MRGAQANGEQIHSARLTRGLTQEQLASLAGIDVKTVRKAEQAKRLDLGTLSKISFALDVDVTRLIIPTRPPQELEIRRRDAVQRWHDCFDVRDMEGLLSVYHEHAVLHLPGGPDFPHAGDHYGKEAIRRANEIAWAIAENKWGPSEDVKLLVSDNAVILDAKRGVRQPDGEMVKHSTLQRFTFFEDTELVIDHRAEHDTLSYARIVQLPVSGSRLPSQPHRRPTIRKLPGNFPVTRFSRG